MNSRNGKTLVIQHGTLIDGSGRPATVNESIVIEGNRIRSVGRLPADVRIEDQDHVQVIDATEQLDHAWTHRWSLSSLLWVPADG